MRKERIRDRVTGRRNGRNHSYYSETGMTSNHFQTYETPNSQLTRKIDPRWKERFFKASTQVTEVPAWGQIEAILSIRGRG